LTRTTSEFALRHLAYIDWRKVK